MNEIHTDRSDREIRLLSASRSASREIVTERLIYLQLLPDHVDKKLIVYRELKKKP